MSLYNKANLIMTPSGAKPTKLYSHKPHNGDGDFTFARNSTGTRVNKDGYIETVATGEPRLDYPLIDGVVQDCPSLLLEPSRTNVLQRSEEFDNAYWMKSLTSVTANSTISPDGSQTADTLTKNGDYGALVKTGISISSGVKYTLSIFVKKGTTDFFSLRQASGSNDVRKQFNLITKEVSNGLAGNQTGFVSSEIKEYPNDWYKLSIVCTSNSTSLTGGFYSGKVGESTFNGDTFIWGAQLEQGSYPTSYIPTSGSSVTRSAETCNSAGNASTFNDSEGVLMAEISALANDGEYKIISIKNSSSNAYENTLGIMYTNLSNELLAVYRVGTSSLVIFTHNINSSITNSKICFKYKSGDFAMWVDGFEVGQSANTTMLPNGTLNEILFSRSDNTSPFYGNTKQIAYFDSALTDIELEDLTSWDSFKEMAQGQLYTIR